MNGLLVFIRKDLHEILHNRAFFMMLFITFFIIFMITSSIGDGIDSLAAEQLTDSERYETVQSLVGTLLLMLMFTMMLIVSLYMNAYTVLLEKTKRTLESVLCTPVKLSHLWFGKTLATFIPSLVLTLLFTAGTFVVMNITTVSPEVGRWVYPGAATLVAMLAVLPVIVFILSSLVVLLQLTMRNVRLIQTLFTALIFGSSFSLSYAFRFSSAGWNVTWIALGIALLLGLLTWFFSGKLTKERIVLTSKG